MTNERVPGIVSNMRRWLDATADKPLQQYMLDRDAVSQLVASLALEPGAERLLAALKTIRFAGRNEHPTAVWMQKVAAYAMEPERWPEQPPEPPAEPADDSYRAVSAEDRILSQQELKNAWALLHGNAHAQADVMGHIRALRKQCEQWERLHDMHCDASNCRGIAELPENRGGSL